MSAPVIALLDQRIKQEDFGELVGISQQRVSQLMADGILPRDVTGLAWLRAYTEHLREYAAGRRGDGDLDLVQERAALARAQRIAQDMKNAVTRAQYAPVGLLADVLSAASAGVVDRFDQLDGVLKKACPDLPEAARTALHQVLASARNEWIRSTEKLAAETLDAIADEQDEPPMDPFEPAGVVGDTVSP